MGNTIKFKDLIEEIIKEELELAINNQVIEEGIYTINVYDKKDSTGGTLVKKVNVRAKTIKDVKTKLKKKYPFAKYFYQIDFTPEGCEYQPGIL